METGNGDKERVESQEVSVRSLPLKEVSCHGSSGPECG